MHKPIKYAEKVLAGAANAAWAVLQLGYRMKRNPSFIPKWSDQPILKSWEKTKPTLGWPRQTDSLCPVCTRELRQDIVDGKKDV
ncbi:MAG: radical SAM protein, partial [Acidobacteria bacterium]